MRRPPTAESAKSQRLSDEDILLAVTALSLGAVILFLGIAALLAI